MLKNKKGFTYIEVIFALVVMAAIFSAVLPLLLNTVTKNRDSRLKLIAFEAASNKIEELREHKISSLIAPSHNPFDILEIPGATGDVYITKPLGDQKIASIEVTVNWNFKTKPQKVELKTYLYGSTE